MRHVANIYGAPLYFVETTLGRSIASLPHLIKCGYPESDCLPYMDTVGPFVSTIPAE